MKIVSNTSVQTVGDYPPTVMPAFSMGILPLAVAFLPELFARLDPRSYIDCKTGHGP